MPLPSDVVVVEVAQRSQEWWAARAGRVTSSRCDVLFVKGRKKDEESIQRRDYRVQIALEQITGRPAGLMDDWKGPWVERGKQLEAEARAAYEALTASAVWTPGFLSHTSRAIGSSIDGAVGDFQIVTEFKVPKEATHLSYLLENVLPREYEWQVMAHFLLSGAPIVDFVSYCPTMPDPLQLFVKRVPRPPVETIAAFDFAVRTFLQEVEHDKQTIRDLMARVEASRAAGVAA